VDSGDNNDVRSSVGLALLLAGTCLGTIAAFALRERAPRVVVIGVLAVVGACLGAGALLVQDRDVNAVNWAATLVGGAVLAPVHVLVAFGRPRAGARA
jgi:hypothetical protein